MKIRLEERQLLQAMYDAGTPITEIADKLGVHKTTVYAELNRGCTFKALSNGRIGYSAEIAQAASKGPGRKRLIAKTLQKNEKNGN